MSKTRIDIPTFMTPALYVAVWHVPDVYHETGWDFHVIGFWNWYHFNPFDLLIGVAWDPLNPPEPGIIYPQQLGMAAMITSNPLLVADCCTWCRGSWNHPWIPQLNINRGENRLTSFPVCAYNGDTSRYPQWTPDFWPPRYFE